MSIEEAPYTFHQTLTFRGEMRDSVQAKRLLKKLLDSLGKRFPEMATLFVQERQGNGNVHYHVRFYFFDSENLPFAPSKMKSSLQSEVFKRWNALNAGQLARQANRLCWSKDKLWSVKYLLKQIEPVRNVRSNVLGGVNWWGCRRKSIMRINSSPVSNLDVMAVFNEAFPKKARVARAKPVQPSPERLAKDALIEELKAFLEKPRPEWDDLYQRPNEEPETLTF